MLNTSDLYLPRNLIALFLSVTTPASITLAMEVQSSADKQLVVSSPQTIMVDSPIDRVAVIQNQSPDFIKAINKVKSDLQMMQARTRDYIQVMKAFVRKFSDSTVDTNKKFEIIDPIWVSMSEKNGLKQSGKREALQEKLKNRRATIDVAKNEFQKRLTVARNGLQGYQALIDKCDDYLDDQDPQILTALLDSLIGSHLLSLSQTVKRFMPASSQEMGVFHSHLSLKEDEINMYYTQDARLDALSELYYVADFLHPIHTLLKTGLQPEAKEWSFCETLQNYVKGMVTLDDPTIFLLDGFLYNKGIVKAKTSSNVLSALSFISSRVEFGGTISGDALELEPLLILEQKKAKEEFDALYTAHRERVEAYIKKHGGVNQNNIKASREFLETALNNNSSLSLVPTIMTNQPQPVIPKSQKRNAKKKANQQQKQTNTLTSIHSLLTNPNLATTTNKASTTESTSTCVIQTAELLKEDGLPTSSLVTEGIERQLSLLEKDLSTPTIPSLESKPSLKEQPLPKILPPLTSPVNRNANKENIQRNLLKGKSRQIILDLLNAKTSPFTIGYATALNAMRKLGITELTPTRKGDYRKLVRVDSTGAVIGKAFAYCPTTSSIGYELMKIYRNFIESQLHDRVDLRDQL